MKNINPSLFDMANSEYQSGNFRKARILFQELVNEYPQSIEARVGFIITLTRFLRFKEAEDLLNTVDDSVIPNLDELTRFRIIYSKARLLHYHKNIQDGLTFLDHWISKIDPLYQPILLIEKASFLLLENKNREALDFIMKSNESLMPELRVQTIGRIIFILTGMKERSLALRFAIEDFKLRPAFPKLLQIVLLGIIGNPFYFSLISITWLILWFIIPINTFSKVALILCVILFGIIPIIIFPKGTKGVGIILLFSWFVTIFMYLLKTFHIYLQIGILIGFIVALLLELVIYKSLFRNEGKGHTIY